MAPGGDQRQHQDRIAFVADRKAVLSGVQSVENLRELVEYAQK